MSAVDALAHLTLVIPAVAGQPVTLSGRPGSAWTDGSEVHLDSSLQDDDLREQALALAVLVQVGAASRAAVQLLGRRRGALDRYVLLEVARGVRGQPWLAPHLSIPRGVPTSTSSIESAGLAVGTTTLPPKPAVWGTVRARRGEPAAAAGATAGGAVGAHLLLEPDEEEDDDQPGEDSLFLRLFSSPLGSSNLSRRLRAALKGNPPHRDADGQTGNASVAAIRHGIGASSAEARLVDGIGPSAASEGLSAAVPREHTYPEWDLSSGTYRADWCHVLELTPSTPTELTPSPRHADHLRPQLAALALGLGRRRRRPNGEDLDVDALVEARVDARTGSTSEDVYIASERIRRDLSILVLLDISGSAADHARRGSDSVHLRQVELTATLVGTLAELGDRVACYAFHSRGRHTVHLHRIKTFDQRWDHAAHQRLRSARPGSYTRLGAAIRHCTHLLTEGGGTDRRLLVVISDGFPYDEGYSGEYAAADTRQAIAEGQRAGIPTVCLTVGAAARDLGVAEVFSGAAIAELSSSSDLGPLVVPLFRRALQTTR